MDACSESLTQAQFHTLFHFQMVSQTTFPAFNELLASGTRYLGWVYGQDTCTPAWDQARSHLGSRASHRSPFCPMSIA